MIRIRRRKIPPNPIIPWNFFPKLPIELRLMIWEEALPGPRVFRFGDGAISIEKTCPSFDGEEALSQYSYYYRDGDDREENTQDLDYYGVPIGPQDKLIRRGPHNLLSTNMEARRVCLRHYTLVPIAFPKVSVYVDFSRDIFSFESIEDIRQAKLPYEEPPRDPRASHIRHDMHPFFWERAIMPDLLGRVEFLAYDGLLSQTLLDVLRQFKALRHVFVRGGREEVQDYIRHARTPGCQRSTFWMRSIDGETTDHDVLDLEFDIGVLEDGYYYFQNGLMVGR